MGGRRPQEERLRRGHFFEPTVLTHVRPEMLIYGEETFGPVLPVMSFEDEQEVLERANDSRYGLAAHGDRRDLSRAARMMEGLEYGT